MASADLEIRAADIAPVGQRVAAGYAAVYNVETVIAGAFRERIARGAFANSIANDDVLALLDHDYGRVIGRKAAGTLRLAEDGKGLKVEIDLPDSPDGLTAYELIRRRDLRGMSFGFRVVRESWQDLDDLPLRTLDELELVECSVVAMPAYPTTSIALRSLAAHRSSSALKARIRMDLDLKVRGL